MVADSFDGHLRGMGCCPPRGEAIWGDSLPLSGGLPRSPEVFRGLPSLSSSPEISRGLSRSPEVSRGLSRSPEVSPRGLTSLPLSFCGVQTLHSPASWGTAWERQRGRRLRQPTDLKTSASSSVNLLFIPQACPAQKHDLSATG